MSDSPAATPAPVEPPETVELTRASYDQLAAELVYLRDSRRPKLLEQARRTRLFMSADRAALQVNTIDFDLSLVDARVAQLEAIVSAAQVVNRPQDSTIELGSTFSVRIDNGSEETLTIVSPPEADPARGLVSSESPVGKALLGKASGEKLSLEADGQTMTLQIDQIGSFGAHPA